MELCFYPSGDGGVEIFLETSGVYSGGAKYCCILNFIDLIFPNSVIGTSSLRRAAQLKKKFPQLEFRDIVSFHGKMLNLGKVAERIM